MAKGDRNKGGIIRGSVDSICHQHNVSRRRKRARIAAASRKRNRK